MVVHQTPLQCEFEVRARLFQEGPRHDRYLWIFFIFYINDVIVSYMSGGLSNIFSNNVACFHGSEMKYDDDDNISLIIMSSIDVLWGE